MGRDNSPKERQRKQLERKLGRRASYDRILIVSEGSRSEPNYFREIRAAYRLQTANVEVRLSESGTSPIQVVQSVATQRAEALVGKFTADTEPEPFTAIVELVKLLITLRG